MISKRHLFALLAKDAPNLSADTILQLIKAWEGELIEWEKRDLSEREYAFMWAVGI